MILDLCSVLKSWNFWGKLTPYMLFKLVVALGWSQTPGRSVWIRNQLLSMLSSLIISNTSSMWVKFSNVTTQFALFILVSMNPLTNNLILCFLNDSNQEEVFFALGSDWFLLFLQGHIHTNTVLLVLTLLTHFLSYPNILAKFKEGVSPGTLVETMDMPTNITGNSRWNCKKYHHCDCLWLYIQHCNNLQ